MSARGMAPAPLADALALLEPGDDVFFWIDRAGGVIAARGLADGPVVDGLPRSHDLYLGYGEFQDHVSFDDFHAYEQVVRTTLAAPHLAPAAAALVAHGDLAASAQRTAWSALVARALAVIESGRASKIVCARAVRLRLGAPVDAATLATALARAEGTYRYLIREGDILFAGASPERLIQKQGDTIRTEAVAGTAALEHGDTPLHEREKDRREHLAVVLAIEEALAPNTLALDHADEPLVRRVGRVQHLVTPFEGRVDPATHVLDYAAALHPTPAVAGTPRDVALDFIARHEGFARGPYAGPIGWHDRNGDGELAVALRCVRIENSALDLFAGAGIVAGSDADAEFDETVLKMRSTLASLGIEIAA
ncbi:MAG TPA: isochorismate synthase [Longimicrobiales bacterium]